MSGAIVVCNSQPELGKLEYLNSAREEKSNVRMNQALKEMFYRRVDEILYYLWDPIGVKEEPAARSEYSNYLNTIYSLVIDCKDQHTIAKQLRLFEQSDMGLISDEVRLMKIANVLIETKNAIEEGLS